MTARLQKIGKKRGNFWMFGWWVWFFTHWSAATALVEKDEADSCHRWPQYNALPGRFKGCYSFRYPNKVQLRFWLIQIFFWKPNSREIDVPPLCEMHCRPLVWAKWPLFRIRARVVLPLKGRVLVVPWTANANVPYQGHYTNGSRTAQ